jgi:YegS/Rv2252/BmrU family lipid kinase
MPGAIHVILNAASGLKGKEQIPEIVKRVFHEHGFETIVHHPPRETDICALARGLVSEGATVIVAGGGDGTLNAVASAVAGTDTAFGVLPIGTLNHFARDLKIPFEIEEAARVIAECKTVQVDIGEVNGRRFINNAIIGLYPVYRAQREHHEKRGRSRFLAALTAVINVLRINPAMHVRLQQPGAEGERRTPILMVGNNRHEMEGYKLGNRDRMDEGLLWLYLVHRMNRLGLLRLGLSILLGRFSKSQTCEVLSAPEFVVESSRKSVRISLDGEVVKMNYPLRYKSLPRALRVIVPANPKTDS